MLTRRHIRIKVLQTLYALQKSPETSLDSYQRFLKKSMDGVYSLYLLQLHFLKYFRDWNLREVEARQKAYLETSKSTFVDPLRFYNNSFLTQITESEVLFDQWDRRKMKQWYLNEKYVANVHASFTKSDAYLEYMNLEQVGYAEDKEIVLLLFREFLAPDDGVYDFIEDEQLTWIDDYPVVNTFILKRFSAARKQTEDTYWLPELITEDDDLDFGRKLLTKVALKYGEYAKEIEGKTPNWDQDRIAEIDKLLLILGIAELLDFPSIPPKVTLNEYLEIAKEYSTPKSSLFINGILDNLSTTYKEEGRLIKSGRGLL
ncbi:MAG: transcription antitermination protein NusB [Flavobacteriaceae bacterium]|nr:transcription antitermination protein NusB [Flavobacteriaceae bacterium]